MLILCKTTRTRRAEASQSSSAYRGHPVYFRRNSATASFLTHLAGLHSDLCVPLSSQTAPSFFLLRSMLIYVSRAKWFPQGYEMTPDDYSCSRKIEKKRISFRVFGFCEIPKFRSSPSKY